MASRTLSRLHLPRALRASMLLAFCLPLMSSAADQTNAEPDMLRLSGAYNLSPLARVLPKIFLGFGSTLLVVGGTLAVLRYRLKTNLYKAVTDANWQDDAHEEAAILVDEDKGAEACADFGKPAPEENRETAAAQEPVGDDHARIYTPASGPAWREPLLEAFLCSCLKASCLGRAWHDEAARAQPDQSASRRPLDPRSAEFIRRLKARWHEFHVDPDQGIFVEHCLGGSERSRVCVIEVAREKHTVTHAALNAGIVIESVGRYLKSSDVAYPTGVGYYHAPDNQERTGLSPEQRKGLLRLKNIPNPWEVMIAGPVPKKT